MSDSTLAQVRVTGRVQGVGFRRFVEARGRAHGVRGWVRNCRDGSVELCAKGLPAAIAALLDEVRRGPPGAVIAHVTPVAFSDDEPLPMPFAVRFD